MKSWLLRPLASSSLLSALLALSLVVLFSKEGEGGPDAGNNYTIVMRHDGVDAKTMERTVAIPLEDELSSISGLKRLWTVSEFGEVRAVLRFSSEKASRYEALSLAAERVYARLPRSAQRPEILFRDEGRASAWTAAVRFDGPSLEASGSVLEREVKPAFRRLPGVGEVETAGVGLPELFLTADAERLAGSGREGAGLAGLLARTDGLFPSGRIVEGDRELRMSADGRLGQDIALTPIPSGEGQTVPLGSLAVPGLRQRRDGPRSRLDGEEAALVSVIPASGADLIALSSALAAEVSRFSSRGLRFEVLEDSGAILAASRLSVMRAAVFGSLIVALTAFFLVKGPPGQRRRLSLLAAASVPVVLILSAALLKVSGFRLDTLLVAALASQIGSALDADLLTVSSLARCRPATEAASCLRSLVPPLLAGAAASLAVLVPLGRLEGAERGSSLSGLVAALASSTLVALFLAFVILPPLTLAALRIPSTESAPPSTRPGCLMLRGVRRRCIRAFYRINRFACLRPLAVIACAVVLSGAGLCSLALTPQGESSSPDGASLPVHLEFETGTRLEVVDERLGAWARGFSPESGITSIETTARAGSGSALVLFDPGRLPRAAVAELIRKRPPEGAFAWIAGADGGERVWEIQFRGDEDSHCREIAGRAASLLSGRSGVRETVLNFRALSPQILLTPDRERLASASLSFSTVAGELRRAVSAPVAWKRMGAEGEVDARLGCDPASLAGGLWKSLPIPLPGGGSGLLSSFVSISRKVQSDSIVRADRRRSASISVRTGSISPSEAKSLLMGALSGLDLGEGYTAEFDREALERSSRLGLAALSFIAAILLSWLVLGFVTESFIAPMAVIASVPPSLALPALLLPLTGGSLSVETAAAFVAVSGLAVNASILTVEAAREAARTAARESASPAGSPRLWLLCRSRLPVLAATVFTTASGALPFVFLGEASNALARSLALVSTLGVAASFFVSITLIPALVTLVPSLTRPAPCAPRGPVGSAKTSPEEIP